MNTAIQLKTFRFTFSKEFTEELEQFAKIHQYDDRHTFKDAWNEWVNTPFIQEETDRLVKEGFEGNVLDKMYKSARYYYRKKPNSKEPGTEKEKQRAKYSGSSKESIQAMDEHIRAYIYNHLSEDNISTASPADAYLDFCKHNEIAECKTKKTYKNRYYLFSTKTTKM
jgi:hypothetical protein